ncbi:sulfatase [Bacteroidota bacterium]
MKFINIKLPKAISYSSLALTVPLLFSSCAKEEKELNFILINIDDLGWTDLECYGSKYYETPNIDRLASQGLKFTSAYASCAVSSPTRASLMTGRYPARIGITDWIRARFQGAVIPEDKKFVPEYVGNKSNQVLCPNNPYWMDHNELTIAELLKKKDYTTCHIGKWHLGTDDWYPASQGFDLNYGGCDYGHPPGYFDPYDNKERDGIPNLEPRKKGEYLTDREADEAVKFIRDHKDGPFFLNFCPYAVHTPLQAKKELVEKYKAKTPTKQNNAVYAAMIESVDDAVGGIMDILDELKIADNTVIIFTSDNGGLLGYATNNEPLREGKGYPYEGGIRIPLIVRWPGVVEEGSINDFPVISTDIFPTICEAAEIQLPEDLEIDGLSLMPIFNGKNSLDRDLLCWHFPHYRSKEVGPYSIVRLENWKMIKWYEGPVYELYNLENDLSEKNDLTKSIPEKVIEMDIILRNWLNSINARSPVENPDYIEVIAGQ